MDSNPTSTNNSTPRTPPVFSPFSDTTALSEATSEEQPDLGAFTTVLRAWNHFQPHPRIPPHPQSSSSSSRTYGRDSETETDHTYGWSDSRSGQLYGPHLPISSPQSTYTRQPEDNSRSNVPEFREHRVDTPISERSSPRVEGDFSNPPLSSPPSPSRVSTSTSFDFDRSTLAPTRSSARELDVEELESTVWNQPRIASYLESELGVGSAASAHPYVEDEQDEEGVFSPPSSPDSQGTRTIEISSELDGGESRVDSVTLETDDSTEQDLEVPFVSASLNSADCSSTSQDDIDINLDIQDEEEVITPREVSVISRVSQRESTRSYDEDNESASSERDVVSYVNELTTPSSFSIRPSNMQPISFSQSASYTHASSRLSNATSSGYRYPNTMSSLSPISYQFPNESEVSPSDLPRLHIEHSTVSPGSGTLASLEVASEPERREDVEHLNIPSPISSFNVTPDPVVDVDPSPVPSNSPQHQISSNHTSNTAITGTAATPLDPSGSRIPASLSSSVFPNPHSPGYPPIAQLSHGGSGPQRNNNQFSGEPHLLGNSASVGEEPAFMDPSTFHPIHHGAYLNQDKPRDETPAFLHELSAIAPVDESQPSLGYLDEALSFIAAERTKWMEQRESGSGIMGGDSKWKHVIEPKRKRRRKRPPRSAPSTLASTTPLGSATPLVSAGLQTTTTDGDNDNDNDNDNDDDPTEETEDTPRKRLVEEHSGPSGSQLNLISASEQTFSAPAQGQTKKGKTRKGKGKAKDEKIELREEGLDEDTPIPKKERLQELARKLQDLFPEDRSELENIINRLGNNTERSDSTKADKGGDVSHEESETDENDLDPRGRPPRKDDTLIHVFIDHSNILIGLLSHLKRYPPSRVREAKSGAGSLGESHTSSKNNRRPLPPVPASAPVKDVSMANSANHPSSTRTLLNHKESNEDKFPHIPLPSFATASVKDTLSHSLPSTSVLTTHMAAKDREKGALGNMKNKNAHSDGDEKMMSGGNKVSHRKSKKPTRHLWHAALALILERGRPISRRVLVTSSPLYQPMDGIKRLGYEVRIYLRVPDLGDGMDREKYRERERDRGGARHIKSNSASGKNIIATPSRNMDSNGKTRQLGHKRRISSGESGSAGAGGNLTTTSANVTTNSDLHPYYTATHLNNHINASAPGFSFPGTASAGIKGMTRIKYREQGVDELLQLKLHQALAATDEVPDGATIILATGDGNVGQFNEDGFLGPIRTALRKGWKVELYAWEDGLSRSWRREFGEDSEWGRNGMFRIIGMEQFANRLVEAVEW